MIYLVGVGPGRPEYMTGEAVAVLAKAKLVAGFRSVVARFPGRAALVVEAHRVDAFLAELARQVDAGTEPAVVVSGDPGVSSFAAQVIARFGREQCRVIPGISSVQLAFARLGRSWGGSGLVDLHGRKELTARDRAALAAPGDTAILLDPQWDRRIDELMRACAADRKMYLLSDLGTDGEQIVELKRDGAPIRTGRLNIIVSTEATL